MGALYLGNPSSSHISRSLVSIWRQTLIPVSLFTLPRQVQRDDTETMLVDSTGQGSNANPVLNTSDGVPPVIVTSPESPAQPTSYTTQQTIFGDTSLPSFDMTADMSWIYPRLGSQANEVCHRPLSFVSHRVSRLPSVDIARSSFTSYVLSRSLKFAPCPSDVMLSYTTLV